MNLERTKAEELLELIKAEEKQKEKEGKGKLYIFLGYAAGVGKTYAMLETAHELKNKGVDVVAGYIEPHARAETEEKAKGLETIPPMMIDYKGVKLREFDLDKALERKPEILLVDELAHTNAPGLRHPKRYEDIEELLDAGINVYTTVNIQHLESINDIVESITKVHVKERIPDTVFDQAQQIKVVDIEPDLLISRLKEGKVYKLGQAKRALENFFAKEKLIALREIALRRTADKVNQVAEEERIFSDHKDASDYYLGEHILTCVSAAESCDKVIRSASRMAYAFHGKFTAIYVETTKMQNATTQQKALRDKNLRLAETLGAKIVTVFGDDVAFQIAEYARICGATKLVLGRTNHKVFLGQKKGTLTDEINRYSPNLDIFIIPDTRKSPREIKKEKSHKESRRSHERDGGRFKNIAIDIFKEVGVLAMATVIGLLFRWYGFFSSDIIMVYLLGILLLSMWTTRRIAVASAGFSVLLFDWFFVKPYYSFTFYSGRYSITFAIMLLFSVVVSTIVSTERKQAKESAKMVYRTQLLLDNSMTMSRIESVKELFAGLSSRIIELMDLPVIFYTGQGDRLEGPWIFPKPGALRSSVESIIDKDERAVAKWVFVNKKRAGCCTHTLPHAQAMYLPIKTDDGIYGVMGIVLEEKRDIPTFEYGLITAMLNEAALVLARLKK